MVSPDLVVDFLSLFIPAVVGIGGSFWIYNRRQKDQESNLRSAFIAELEGTEVLNNWPNEGRKVPLANFISVSVYDGNTGDLAILSEPETSALVRYYTLAKLVQDALEHHSEIIVRAQISATGSDLNYSDREDSLREIIDKLELTRQRALMMLKSEGNKLGHPSEGDPIEKYNQGLQKDYAILVDYGLVIRKDGRHIFTKEGEEFFNGERTIVGENKTRDTLERDKSELRNTWEQKAATVQSVVRRVFY